MKHGMTLQDLDPCSYDKFNTYTRYGLLPSIDYRWDKVPLEPCETIHGKKHNYRDIIITFDIETSTRRLPEPLAWMYHWQMCIDGKVSFGRDWNSFQSLLMRLINFYNVSRETRLVIFVHNLSYEWQFMKDFFEWESVFLTKEHTCLRAITVNGIEFRCSYFLTNQSLELFCENMAVEHMKVKGEQIDEEEGFNFDYTKIRTPSTPLTWQEKSYCYNDVAGLYEAVKEFMHNNGDNLYTLPMTSTGFVRRDCREAVMSGKYKNMLRKILPDYTVYKMCRSAFRGGDTHALYKTAGQIVYNIDAWDITSSYPYVIMARKFPMSKFIEIDADQVVAHLKNPNKAVILTVRLNGVRQRDIWDMPYLSYSKCENVIGGKYDNGRILSCDSLICTITEVDYKLIKRAYNIDSVEVYKAYSADKEWLPVGIRETIMEYFKTKCELGETKKKLNKIAETRELTSSENEELLLASKNYMKSKNKLNSIYGMMATNPIRQSWSFKDGLAIKEELHEEEQLMEHNNKWSTFLSYAWGVYVTAYARERLDDIRRLSVGSTIYNDTDSVYVIDDISDLIEKYNETVKEECRKCPIPPIVEIGDNRIYMGVVEHDGHYDEFITWGSKRYATMSKGKVKVTVSGLSKTAGAKALCDGATNPAHILQDFKPGWTVEESGNMTAYYNDTGIKEITINGEKFISASNIALFPSSYTLNPTGEYKNLIGYIESKLL